MREYRYFYAERAITYSQSGAYGIIIDTSVQGKNYRMFSEWLVEAYYLRTFLQLSHIPHFTTLQKFTERISGNSTRKVNFIIHNSYKNRTTIRWNRFVWIQRNHASHNSYKNRTTIRWNRFVWIQSHPCFPYYTERVKLRRKYIKLSLSIDVLQQIICTIKIRRAPTRHDSIDFRPLITKISELVPLSVVTADKGYDSEKNHYFHYFFTVRDIYSCDLSNVSQF